jgi:hypothetical protein
LYFPTDTFGLHDQKILHIFVIYVNYVKYMELNMYLLGSEVVKYSISDLNMCHWMFSLSNNVISSHKLKEDPFFYNQVKRHIRVQVIHLLKCTNHCLCFSSFKILCQFSWAIRAVGTIPTYREMYIRLSP